MHKGSRRWLMAGLLWMAATVAVSAGVSWWLLRGGLSAHRHSAVEPEAAFHEWMHRNLKLSREQHAVLEPFEEKFEQDRRRLREEIRALGVELARQVQEAAEMTAETRELLGRLSARQRLLQEATLEHFYEMKAHLNPEQQAKLLRWTQNSLLHEDHHAQEGGHHD